MNQVWDEKTWTQWAWFENGGAVSFDNENAICAKTQYAIEEELGGFISKWFAVGTFCTASQLLSFGIEIKPHLISFLYLTYISLSLGVIRRRNGKLNLP